MNILNKENPVVSIIMPAYNAQHYIENAIDSVINQTYTAWELIVIDDCSDDETLNIIKKKANEDTRIKLLENEVNKGVAYTRNRGIDLAKGEWIAFLDSDDLWKKVKLEKQLNFAYKKNAEFTFTGTTFINEKNVEYDEEFKVPKTVDFKILKKHNVICCSSVIIKKGLFENIRMERDDLHEDFIVWLKILKNKSMVAYGLNEPLLIYRISSDSKSGNKFKSVVMTYNVYRYIGMNPVLSLYFTMSHSYNAFSKKYKSVFKKMRVSKR